jgi:hypothetical protein
MGEYIAKPKDLQGVLLNEFFHLEDAGLIAGVGTLLSRNYRNPMQENANVIFKFARSGVFVLVSAGFELNLPNVILTNVGREILKIVEPEDSTDQIREFIDGLPKTE